MHNRLLLSNRCAGDSSKSGRMVQMVQSHKKSQRAACICATARHVANQQIQTVAEGEVGTLEYRMRFKNAEGLDMSPWHSVPLHAGKGLYNFVCEIPRNTSAKYEVATTEDGNPIKQDSKKGKPRHYAVTIPWNYGMLPQTWEDPTHASEDCANHIGDNDPVDIVEIGDRTAATGEIYAVKPIAALAMIDEGELDWKVLAVSAQDPRCDLVHDVADLDIHFPGAVSSVREWFRTYKTFDGKPENKFELGERAMDRDYTLAVIEQTHGFWKAMVQRVKSGAPGVKLAVGSVPIVAKCLESVPAKAAAPADVAGTLKRVLVAVREHENEWEGFFSSIAPTPKGASLSGHKRLSESDIPPFVLRGPSGDWEGHESKRVEVV